MNKPKPTESTVDFKLRLRRMIGRPSPFDPAERPTVRQPQHPGYNPPPRKR